MSVEGQQQSEKSNLLSGSLRDLLTVVTLISLVIDVFGFFFAGDGFFSFLKAYFAAAENAKVVQIGSRAFLTVYVFMGLMAAKLFFRFTPWRQRANHDNRFSLLFVLLFLFLMLATVDNRLMNAPFAGLGYKRCLFEQDVGVGKGRFTKIWFAKSAANCPAPDDGPAEVE